MCSVPKIQKRIISFSAVIERPNILTVQKLNPAVMVRTWLSYSVFLCVSLLFLLLTIYTTLVFGLTSLLTKTLPVSRTWKHSGHFTLLVSLFIMSLLGTAVTGMPLRPATACVTSSVVRVRVCSYGHQLFLFHHTKEYVQLCTCIMIVTMAHIIDLFLSLLELTR